MAITEFNEPASEILDRTRKAGFKVSEAQLARWHRSGLLPKPRTRSLGKGHGTQTIYPAGTGRQLLELCRLRRKYGRLGNVAWRLWFEGYPVAQHLWHPPLQAWAADWDRAVAEIERVAYSDGDDSLSDEALDAIESMASRRFPSPAIRQLRKRVGRKNFPTLLRLIIELATGRFSKWHAGSADSKEERQNDMAILEKGLGFRRARTDRVAPVGSWLQGDIAQPLAEMALILKETKFASLVEAASIAELSQARDELAALLQMLGELISVLEAVFGKNAFGYGTFVRLAGLVENRDLGLLLLGWCALRRVPAVREGLDQLLRMTPVVHAQTETYERIKQLSTEDPAFADALSDRTLAGTLRSKTKRKRHLAELARIRTLHKNEIKTE